MIEYGQMFIWVGLFIVFVIGEIISLGITSIWFAGGALVAFFVSLITDVFWIQFAVFAVVSMILLAFTRPLAKKYFNGKNLEKTNVEAVVGQVGVVKEVVNNIEGTGVVVIKGLEWSARTTNDKNVIEAGTNAKVVDVKGVTVIVEKAI